MTRIIEQKQVFHLTCPCCEAVIFIDFEDENDIVDECPSCQYNLEV
jgi:hypothetical protein